MKAIAFTLSVISLGAALAQPAAAQNLSPNERRAEAPALALAGAGGRGGAGAGGQGVALAATRCGVAYANPVSEYTSHVRSSAPPPMDPCRKVEIADCTRPMAQLSGNLLCR